MTLFHQLLNMKVDWGDACKGLSSPIRGLVHVLFDMLPEGEGVVKEKAQVPPNGTQVQGGSPGVWGIAKVNVRVDIAMLLREMKSL